MAAGRSAVRPRVVSLVPSATETLLAWDVDVVACTRFCEQPHLMHVGGTKDPDIAAIVALGPDVVVMDREENRREDSEALRDAGLTLHVSDVRNIDDVSPTLDELAVAVGVPASTVVGASAAATDPIRARAFVPIWRRPWMTISARTYGSSLLQAVGIANVFADEADAYPVVTLDDVAARRPELVVVPSEPYAFRDRHVGELREALPGATVVLVDGQDLFWWGVRTPDALERIRASLLEVRRPR